MASKKDTEEKQKDNASPDANQTVPEALEQGGDEQAETESGISAKPTDSAEEGDKPAHDDTFTPPTLDADPAQCQ